jgi:hypothetical protein
LESLASGSWLTRSRVTAFALVSGGMGATMLLFLLLTSRATLDVFGQPLGTDFTAFWHAGRIANSGDAASAWDPNALNRAVMATHHAGDYSTAWHYPPLFLIIAAPLALLPYLPALILWQAVSLALFALTLRAILPDFRATLVGLASPITPMVLAHGQNGFLTVALLGSGLLLLRRRPGSAGVLFGALAYKPPLAPVIVPLLAVTGQWKVASFAALAFAALVLVSIFFWGVASWSAFLGSLELSRWLMEQGTVGFHKFASLFAALRMWGVSISLSYMVQAIGFLAALWMIWRLRASEPGVVAAGACAAVALSTPYLLDYDLAVVGLGAAFLYAEAVRRTFLPYERTAIAFIWIVPWFSRSAAELFTVPLAQSAVIVLALLAMQRAGVTASPSRRLRAASAQ